MTTVTRWMKVHVMLLPDHPHVKPQWWQWARLLGLVVPALLVLVSIRRPIAWAGAAHLFCDFTAQSTPTALGKARRDWRILAYHGLSAGGWPGYVLAGLPGLALGTLTHALIDATGKFGYSDWRGPLADQLAHALVLLVLFTLF